MVNVLQQAQNNPMASTIILNETIPSKMALVPDFISSAVEKLRLLPVKENDIFNIKLCLHEAVVNAVKHGNKLNSALGVHVLIKIDKSQLTLEVSDQGEGFDYRVLPDPTTPENIMQHQGRGIYLIRKIMNDVKFFSKGRTIKMIKLFESKGGESEHKN